MCSLQLNEPPLWGLVPWGNPILVKPINYWGSLVLLLSMHINKSFSLLLWIITIIIIIIINNWKPLKLRPHFNSCPNPPPLPPNLTYFWILPALRTSYNVIRSLFFHQFCQACFTVSVQTWQNLWFLKLFHANSTSQPFNNFFWYNTSHCQSEKWMTKKWHKSFALASLFKYLQKINVKMLRPVLMSVSEKCCGLLFSPCKWECDNNSPIVF